MLLSLGELVFLKVSYVMRVLVKGGGFRAFWYCLGALKHFPNHEIFAYSSGSLAGVVHVCSDLGVEDIVQAASELLEHVHLGMLFDCIQKFLWKVLAEDAFVRANACLHIVLSYPLMAFAGRVIDNWQCNQELIETVVASCMIPFVTAPLPWHPSSFAVDGGLAWNVRLNIPSIELPSSELKLTSITRSESHALLSGSCLPW